MLKRYLVGSVVAFTLMFSIATADSTHAPIRQILPVGRNEIQLAVSRYAFVYGVPESQLHQIIECESTHNPNAVNITSREYSIGLVQINLKAHPNISETNARNIDFSVRFLAKNLSEGRGSMWSCYKS